MTKMLVIDLDDTLLHSDKTISDLSVAVLKEAYDRGIKIVLATARPIRTLKQYLEQIKCHAAVCHNGAVTLIGDRRCNESFGIPFYEAEKLLNNLQNRYPGKRLSVEMNDMIYANFDVTLIWGRTEKEKEILKSSSVMTDFTDLPGHDADKIIIELDSTDEYGDIQKLISSDLYAQLSDGGRLCLIMNRNATKLNAVRELAGQWDIPLTDIAAFGDDYNDIGLIRSCGVGVAMKNAINEVLEAAYAVTGTNNEDGVAEYIKEHILK